LTRGDAAKLIWTCWRYREMQKMSRGPMKGLKVRTGKEIDRIRWFCGVFVQVRSRLLRFGEVVSGAKLVRLPDALGKTDGMGDCFIPWTSPTWDGVHRCLKNQAFLNAHRLAGVKRMSRNGKRVAVPF
jgi:hypothetical protein